MSPLFEFPRNLADWLVLEVGLWQYARMNEPRAVTSPEFPEGMVTRATFLQDLSDRIGRDRSMVEYLMLHLTEARMALPDGYVLGQRPQFARPGACAYCDEMREKSERMFPPHFSSRLCESGGRPHCTCDYCF